MERIRAAAVQKRRWRWKRRLGARFLSRAWVSFALAGVGAALALPAAAHNEWANGQPVPAWIKAACCGPADAHHLRPDQVHDEGDFYVVDGYVGGPDNGKIYKTVNMGGGRSAPNPSIIPSQDGDYWIFYRDGRRQCDRDIGGASICTVAAQSNIYCFFVPMNF
jgi:hypothetical protein